MIAMRSTYENFHVRVHASFALSSLFNFEIKDNFLREIGPKLVWIMIDPYYTH